VHCLLDKSQLAEFLELSLKRSCGCSGCPGGAWYFAGAVSLRCARGGVEGLLPAWLSVAKVRSMFSEYVVVEVRTQVIACKKQRISEMVGLNATTPLSFAV
jgi:hypothetical protein